MDQTANLLLPYIMPSQAQKHVTHNEAIRALDALVQLAVLDRDLSTPPASPAEGDRYLVAPGSGGAWTGKDGRIAAWQDGAWAFLAPRTGWLIWAADELRLLSFDGAAWVDAALHSVNPTPLVGVNATADATNRLAVKSPAALFDQESGDHRLKINKAAAGDTASLLFQSGYSGRAEFGLAGDDDWHVKVSPDGAAWVEALKVDAATGRVSLPAALALGDDNQVVARRHVREMLAANRTYYVRADGSDGNSGLADNAGGAFLTLQKAIDTTAGLDLATFNVTIQIEDGAWTVGAVVAAPWIGSGAVTLRGNPATPANCTISAGNAVIVTGAGSRLTVSGLTLVASSVGLLAENGGTITLGSGMVFGACTAAHMRANGLGASIIAQSAAYSISGNAGRHLYASPLGYINTTVASMTLVGTRAFGTAFADADRLGSINAGGAVITGSATGKRYNAASNGLVNTGGGGASFFPGSVAGTTATGGLYI
jgi:hypothetical protein